jgi:hypothetical protein
MNIGYQDSWESFHEWTAGFRKKHEGYFPQNLKGWFDRVESQHANIRKIIGGTRKQAFYQLKSTQSPISKQDAEPLVKEILNIVPQYLAGYGFTEEVFLRPTIQQGTHSVFKTGKHVRTYANSHVRDQKVAGDSKPKFAKLDKALSELGLLWAKARTSDIELEATLSTSPKSFMLLGHYGPDSDSCFRNGSDKTNHKFVLGQTADTFTFSISKKHPTKPKNVNVCRAFGWLGNNCLNFCNPYLVAGFPEGDALEVMNRISAEILKAEVDVKEDYCEIAGSGEHNNGIYNNPYGRWTFYPKGQMPGVQILRPYRNFIQVFECENCHDVYDRERDLQLVDDILVCPHCVQQAEKCEITNQLSLKPLVNMISDNGLSYLVHPKYAQQFPKCKCGTHSQILQKVNGEELCPECVESQMSECTRCNKLFYDNDLSDIGDSLVCEACMTQEDILAEYLSSNY